ncbi:CLP1 [Lepeophtheirus salmonis]|uniref:CLP1 n=1 Tax=Lepeophtheirus salmonis TaxID=72036 RepID=A0A7R8CJT6_LEPSM|nr:CLP1 [Lepeophtheirus salmonis]CAF2844069.1 CLP1 [Lepeophtheirus salmonis]
MCFCSIDLIQNTRTINVSLIFINMETNGHLYTLKQDEELRIEVECPKNETITIELKSGTAEIFGTEMVMNTKYKFLPGTNFSIFTYHGCQVLILGNFETSPYASKETPMIMYLNTHAALEEMRKDAERKGKRGPVFMVVGPTDVGKSTLCRLFLNYANVQHPLTRMVSLKMLHCIKIIPSREGYDLIKHIAKAFEVDVITVLDQERVYNDLKKDMPDFVKIMLQPKSGGVVNRSQSFRIQGRDLHIKRYFYGRYLDLFPHSFDMSLSDLKNRIYRLIPVPLAPKDLLNHILSVSFSTHEDDAILSNIAGLICITNVNVDENKLTILSPQPKPLPNTILLSLRYKKKRFGHEAKVNSTRILQFSTYPISENVHYCYENSLRYHQLIKKKKMGSTETLCLRWNEFESSIKHGFFGTTKIKYNDARFISEELNDVPNEEDENDEMEPEYTEEESLMNASDSSHKMNELLDEELLKFVSKRDEDKKFKCLKCSLTFRSKQVAKFHVEAKHFITDGFECDKCSRSSRSNPYFFTNHFVSCCKGIPIPSCSTVFSLSKQDEGDRPHIYLTIHGKRAGFLLGLGANANLVPLSMVS